MKTKLKLSVACGIAALLVGLNVQAEEKTFSIGGDLELDLTAKNESGDVASSTSYYNGGRVKLSAVGELKGDNYFVKGVAQPLVPFKGNSLGYDDVYLQFGRSEWDVQIGRFEGFDLFPAGKDTVAEHGGDPSLVTNARGVKVYGANDARGRKDNVIHAAAHLKPNDAMNFELGVMGAKNTSDYEKFAAVRPAMTYNAGIATIRAGVESVRQTNAAAGSAAQSHTGFGLGAGVAVGGGSLNVSIAKKNVSKGESATYTDTTSAAVNFTQGPWGVGYLTSTQNAFDGGSDPKLNTFYAAYTVPLFGSKDASVTFAASTSKATNVGADDADHKVNAFRTRFNYSF